MAENSSIQMSQGYDMLPPKTGQAYPILCEEWDYLKTNVGTITERPNVHHSIGCVLLGACLSTLSAIFTGTFPSPDPEILSSKLIIAWAIAVVIFIVGVMFLYLGREQRKVLEKKASDILRQMEFIQKRYQTENGYSQQVDEGSTGKP